MTWRGLERLGALCITVGALIWGPDFYRGWRIERAIAAYEVKETFDVRSVAVGNTVAGEPVIMDVDRTIHKEFFGIYAAEVRTFPRKEVVCTGPLVTADILYSPEAQLPDPLTLSWWMDSPGCRGPDLPPGEYIVVTTWTVRNDLRDVPDHKITVISNPFSLSAVDAVAAIERLKRLESKSSK